MPKPDAKKAKTKSKVDVAEAGSDAALKHNPFARLGGAMPAQTAVPPEGHAPSGHVAADASAQPVEPEVRAKSRGRLVLRREKKQRGGKTVVVVSGLRANAHLPESEIETIARTLRQQLGCGGSTERVPSDTVIVVQGDQPARVAEVLRGLGFRVDGTTE